MNAIDIQNLTKVFPGKTAVNHVRLQVQQGETLALLGVNGAGKTTLIRMLCCLSAPTEGEAFLYGHSCTKEPEWVKRIIGLSPQDTAVSENLTVLENLRFMAQIHGYTDKQCKEKVARMIRSFRMESIADQRARTLSGGWKRKLSIAMALMGEPQVLFLDEPTLGLDVLARRDLWHIIRALKGKTTILLTTHYMEEAEQLADRIAVMLEGNIAACGTLSELEETTGRQGLEEAFVAIAERGMQDA